MIHPFWSLVLAAGAGRRLAALTGGVPKQFWRTNGRQTLLEDTLDRTTSLASRKRTVIVVDERHEKFVQGLPLGKFERLVYQPADRGTAAGVLFGLIEILSSAPDALVLLTPSDHGIADRERFIDGIREAADEIQRQRAKVVLFGVAPSAPVGDYGWILPGPESHETGRLRPVSGFVEKPAPELAGELFAGDAVWNTMVLVSRASTLYELFARQVPELASVFAGALGRPEDERGDFLHGEYERLPVVDFSRDVLGRADGLSVHTWPASMGWSDLGTPDRLEAWWNVQLEGADIKSVLAPGARSVSEVTMARVLAR